MKTYVFKRLLTKEYKRKNVYDDIVTCLQHFDAYDVDLSEIRVVDGVISILVDGEIDEKRLYHLGLFESDAKREDIEKERSEILKKESDDARVP